MLPELKNMGLLSIHPSTLSDSGPLQLESLGVKGLVVRGLGF